MDTKIIYVVHTCTLNRDNAPLSSVIGGYDTIEEANRMADLVFNENLKNWKEWYEDRLVVDEDRLNFYTINYENDFKVYVSETPYFTEE